MSEKTKSKGKKHPLRYIVISVFAVAAVLCIIFGKGSILSGLENTLGGRGNNPSFGAEGIGIVYFDVGQGDSALVICDGKTMLIDAGENGYEEELITRIHSLGIKKLDYAVCTHFHTDHIGGMPEIIDEFAPDTVLMPAVRPELIPDSYTYGVLIESISEYDAEIVNPVFGESFDFGKAKVYTLGPVSDDAENHNDSSLILKFTYGKRSFLFTGDAEKDEELSVIAEGADVSADVLKVGHHGSANSSCAAFLEKVSPSYCIISVGAGNDYGHPHEALEKRLLQYTGKIYRTDICSDIYLVSDGNKIKITYGE
ncbi:MAG: MBL fold metallo-hydrolase [Clostridia bacterium]|nr:MBL fold metallo-hydrolase [Clostridia bacterium]